MNPECGLRERQDAGCVGKQLAVQPKGLARQHDRDAVVADRAADQQHIAVPDPVEAEHVWMTDADAGGGEIESAAFAAPQHLGVAGDHRDADVARGLPQARDDAFQGGDFQAFLDEGIEAEIARRGAGDRKVVGGAMYGEGADVATGKFQRLHGEAVGGEHYLAAVQCQRHGVGLHVEAGIGQVAGKDLLDQFAHEAATVAVRQ